MNYEDFGSLFAAKRKEKGYTQKTIAAVLHTTDKSISRWETNKSLPDIDMMKVIGEVLEIPLNNLIRFKINENDDTYEVLIDELQDKNKKLKKKLRISLLIFLILVLFFILFLFFVSTFNKFKVYNVGLSGDNVYSSSGVYIDTYYENILNLGHIYVDNNPVEEGQINIYAMDGKKRIDIVKNEELSINDQMVLNKEVGDMVNFNYLDSLYLELYIDDKLYTCKIDFMKRFTNNQIFYFKKSFKTDEYSLNKNRNEIIKILSSLNFKKKDKDTYVNEEKHLKYLLKSKKLIYEKESENISTKYDYNFNSHALEVQSLDIRNSEVITIFKYSYNFDTKKLNCKIGYCSDYKEVINGLKPYIKALS